MLRFFFIMLLAGGLFFGYNTYKDYLPQESKDVIEKVKENETINKDIPNGIKKITFLFNIEETIKEKMTQPDWVKLDQIPLVMQQAIISVEDNRFYQHGAFDASGIIRAFLVNIQSGEIVEGGSTITQQLAKNLFLGQEQTLPRKADGAIYSMLIEHNFSKEQILEAYLNTIYFGSGAYGIKQASETYFKKQPHELTLAESSMLAGLPAAPSVYSPLKNPDMAKKRQAIVLETMVKNGFIGPQKAKEVLEENLGF